MTTYTTPLGSFESSRGDAFLGNAVDTDNDRPPLGSFVFGPAYDGTVFIIKDNRLYYSKAKRPEAWPSLNYIEVGPVQFPGKTGVFYNNQPYYLTSKDIYYIQGTSSGSFQPVPTKAKTGAQSVFGAESVDGKGIFHTGPDGIYLYSSGNDTKITEEAFETIFRGNDSNGVPGVSSMTTSWLKAFRNYLYFGYQSSGDTYAANILALNLETGQVEYHVYNDGSDVEISSVAVDETNNRLLIGDGSGYVRTISDKSVTDDSGTDISWQLRSKEYTLPTRAHFPRWTKYDVDASGATSVTGSVILDGSTHHSHTITGDRVTKRRLIGTGNGKRLQIDISGTGPATVYTAETE